MSSGIFTATEPQAAFDFIRKASIRSKSQHALPPVTIPAPDRVALLASHEVTRRAVEATPVGQSRVQWRYARVPRSCSTTPLEELVRAELGDLKVNERAVGKVVVCRVVGRPYAIFNDLTAVVEDPSGRCQRVELYNLPLDGVQAGDDLDVLFPLGTVLAIREPLLSLCDVGPEGTSVIVVDSPTDFTILTSPHSLLSSIAWSTKSSIPGFRNVEYRNIAGAYFIKQKPRLAESMYSRGLSQPDVDVTESLLLYLNRSAVNLQLGNFASAASDAATSLDLLSSSTFPSDRLKTLRGQGLLRKAKAFDGMRAWSKASSSYLDLLEHSPGNADAVASLRRVDNRLAESNTGTFDWVDVFRRRGQGERSLDVGDHIGPVRPAVLAGRGGGRGVIAARDIKAGELILVEKAFATAFPAPTTQGSMDLPRNARLEVTEQSVEGGKADVNVSLMHDLVFNLVARLVRNPSLASKLYSLHGGHNFPPNCGVPEASFTAEEGIPDSTCCPDIDPERLNEICWSNVYALRKGMSEPVGATDTHTNPDAVPPIALFPFASLFNHACVANAGRETSGDCIIIRSRKAIPAGTEIFIEYSSAIEPDRQKQVSKHIPDGCPCELCQAEEFDHSVIVMARESMAESAPGLMDLVREGSVETWGETYGVIQRQLENASATYRPDNPAHLKPALFALHLVLAEHLLSYPTQKVPDNVADSVLSACTCVGAVLEVSFPPNVVDVVVKEAPYVYGSEVVAAMCLSAKAYREAGRKLEAAAWLKAAKRMRAVLSGGGDDLFVALGDGKRYR
ncbi:hypothetical protein P7C70_g6581, partial [Phenoliferia sp. Uapishka_3]